MKNRILAICDPEEQYVTRLMEYLNERQISPFYVRAFTSRETLEAFVRQEEIEVLLISAEIAEQVKSSQHTGKKILLTDGRVSTEQEGQPAVYKYQSAERIVREILHYYAEEAQPFLQAVLLKEQVQLYGVYSPVQRIGKTTFALALGQVCASERHTLYLNLEPWAGLEERQAVCMPWNLSDLLYFLKRGKEGFLYKLKSMVQSIRKLDYIIPVLSPQDLLAVTGEEWEALIERLIVDAGYECLILDFSDCIQGLFDLLEKCTQVYVPMLEDDISQAKLRQFERIMEKSGYNDLKKKLQRVKLPKMQEAYGTDPMEELPEIWTRFAENLMSETSVGSCSGRKVSEE